MTRIDVVVLKVEQGHPRMPEGELVAASIGFDQAILDRPVTLAFPS